MRSPVFSPALLRARSLLGAAGWRAALLVACAVWFLGCQPKRDPNVLILVIDALRPDHVGAYGYPLATTPTIDGLARKGVLFLDATSSSSYTRAAVPSIFASVHPAAHGVFSQGRQVEALSEEITTLAETLKARGYATAAFAPNPSLHRAFNFDQGFDLYDDDFQIGAGPAHEAHETARKIHARFLRWLSGNQEKPYFAYLHYRDVHGPYVPPPPYDRMFPRSGERRVLTRQEFRSQPADMREPVRFQDLDSYIERYDGEIRYTDDHLKKLLQALDEKGLLENTILFLTADHGESFLEHGAWTHGTSLYEEQTRVPLLMVLPEERSAGVRIEEPVQTIDLYPTVLELLGVEVPAELQGRSLFGALEGKADPLRPVFSEAWMNPRKQASSRGQLVAVRRGGWKLIYNRTSRATELYNLKEDPAETNNLSPREPERTRELLRLIAAYDRDSARLGYRAKGQEGLPPDVVEGLRALGYVN